jgi:hypothetical protein
VAVNVKESFHQEFGQLWSFLIKTEKAAVVALRDGLVNLQGVSHFRVTLFIGSEEAKGFKDFDEISNKDLIEQLVAQEFNSGTRYPLFEKFVELCLALVELVKV